MMYRKVGDYIENFLKTDSNKILVIDGARQIGKSFIIRHIGKKIFPNYIEINMEEDKLGDRLFADVRTVNDFYLAMSMSSGHLMHEKSNTLVFIDEIQAYDHLLTLLKFLKADDRFTYIASGSLLGVTLRSTSSIPMGSIETKNMFPMDFEEFIIANGVGGDVIENMRQKFHDKEELPENLHNKMLSLFKRYLIVGGMPDAVKTYIEQQNIVAIRKVQDDIRLMYGIDASKYEENHNRLKIQRIYEMIPSNMENKKKRVVVKDIEGKAGKRISNYAEEFNYLISSGVTLEVKAISAPTYPLLENSGKNLLKLYMNDVGLLTNIFFKNNIKAIIDDVKSVNLGSVYETVIAQELKAHGFNLYYYDNKKVGEVDYLIDDSDNLSVVPLEIKSGKDYTIHSALNRFLAVKEYNVKDAYVLSNERKVYTKQGITYLPIYYAMFFVPGTAVVGEW